MNVSELLTICLNTYWKRFDQASWSDITNEKWYSALESDLLKDINTLIALTLNVPVLNGFPATGTTAILHGREFTSHVEVQHRTLVVRITFDSRRRTSERWIPINSFGLLQNIHLVFDPVLDRQLVNITENLIGLVNSCYQPLYERFINENKHVNSILAAGIFEYIDKLIQIKYLEKERINEFSGKYWISITDTETDMFFVPRYTSQVNKIAQELIRYQIESHSPYELLVSLMHEECYDQAIDEFHAIRQMSGKIVTNDLQIRFDPKKKLFWLGQRVLFGKKSIGWRFIAEEPPLLLCIDCNSIIAEEFEGIFDKHARAHIEFIFKENVGKYRLEIKRETNS
jgi:hypothetical protein